MFNWRFAFQHAPADDMPWPAMHGWGHGWWGRRIFALQMRRNFFGRGGPFGPGGPFGEEGFPGFPGGGKRFFGRGDLKYALLELLQERPMHGYEMMKALQEQTGGMYTPSAGSIYPTLQMLEDRGFVTVSEVEGKKVHSITDAGRAFLAEGQQEERGEPGRRGFWQAPDVDWATLSEMRQEMLQLRLLFGLACRGAMQDPEKLRRLRALLEQIRAELRDIAGVTDEADE
ncbi:MAG TPA: PadR family transcriptional regulator [Roseiflexaceae bacterium]|nr:PadR family transcriptional regulator [Roseiflexaceae bacterium]